MTTKTSDTLYDIPEEISIYHDFSQEHSIIKVKTEPNLAKPSIETNSNSTTSTSKPENIPQTTSKDPILNNPQQFTSCTHPTHPSCIHSVTTICKIKYSLIVDL